MCKRVLLAIVLAMTLSGCSWASNNSADKTSDTDIASHNTLLSVPIDNRTWIESACPMAVQVGNGSCTMQVTP